MPYSAEHKQETRAKITEAARVLFNQHGFEGVTIDMVMSAAGLTRGGFYNHFENKQQLFAEAVTSFLSGRGAEWREDAGIDTGNVDDQTALKMLRSYLSDEHLGDLEGQCPMIALPSDVARAAPEVQGAYQQLLEAMTWLFETSLANDHDKAEKKEDGEARQKALTLSALCVGGMVLARTLPESTLAEEIKAAAFASANQLIQASSPWN